MTRVLQCLEYLIKVQVHPVLYQRFSIFIAFYRSFLVFSCNFHLFYSSLLKRGPALLLVEYFLYAKGKRRGGNVEKDYDSPV